jgi:adhesin HecA-like repeat protein
MEISCNYRISLTLWFSQSRKLILLGSNQRMHVRLKFWCLTLAAACFFATGAPAVAVPIAFNFTGGAGTQASTVIYSQSGLSVTITSNVINDAGTVVTSAGKVGQWSQGLGILDGDRNDEHFVDGKGKNDVLSFQFSQAVKLISVGFSYNDGNDDFAFLFDGDQNGSLANNVIWKTKDIPGNNFVGSFSFAALAGSSYIGQLFGIGAFGDNDEFKIASFVVDVVQPSAVPLPPAALLLGSAVIGMALRRRRKSDKPA